jgi:hypothetical protein
MMTERSHDLWQQLKRSRYAIVASQRDVTELSAALNELPQDGEDFKLWLRSCGLTWTFNPALPGPARRLAWLKLPRLTHELEQAGRRRKLTFPDPKVLVGRRFWHTDEGTTGKITKHLYDYTFSMEFDPPEVAYTHGFLDGMYALDQELLPFEH